MIETRQHIFAFCATQKLGYIAWKPKYVSKNWLVYAMNLCGKFTDVARYVAVPYLQGYSTISRMFATAVSLIQRTRLWGDAEFRVSSRNRLCQKNLPRHCKMSPMLVSQKLWQQDYSFVCPILIRRSQQFCNTSTQMFSSCTRKDICGWSCRHMNNSSLASCRRTEYLPKSTYLFHLVQSAYKLNVTALPSMEHISSL